MKKITFVITAFFLCAMAYPQEINISGTVTDQLSNPLNNVSVGLRYHPSVTTTTDASGNFMLTQATFNEQSEEADNQIYTQNSNLILNVQNKQIKVEIFNMNGQLVKQVFYASNFSGIKEINIMPYINSNTFYLLRAVIGGEVKCFKLLRLDNEIAISDKPFANRSASKKNTDATVDTLILSLDQYYTYRYALSSYVLNVGTISMTKVSAAEVPLLTGPGTSTGSFDLTVTYSWPGSLAGTSDRFELEESTASSTSGFTVISNSPWNQRPTAYTFSLQRATGTYYYRVRAYNTSHFTTYSEVKQVVVSVPDQTAKLKIVNNTKYPMINILINGVQHVNTGYQLDIGNSYELEFAASQNVTFHLGVGFWDGSTRDEWFYNEGTAQVTVGQTTTVTFNNPTIAQMLSGFSNSRDWRGEYWVNTIFNYATFRFFSNGTWNFYDNGAYVDNGNVTLVSWPDYSTVITFKVCSTCGNILLYYPFGQFYYNNGPADWKNILYTAQ